MKSLEVPINGKVVGIFVPPKGAVFAAMLGNIPRKYMRAHIHSGGEPRIVMPANHAGAERSDKISPA